MLTLYVRLWATKTMLQTSGAASILASEKRLGDALLFPVVVLAFAFPQRLSLVMAAHVGWAALCLYRAPFIWDLNWWDILLDLGFVFVTMETRDPKRALRTVADQMLLLYVGAALWKLNWSYLDPRYSCGTVIIFQLMSAYLPSTLVRCAAPIVAKLAPASTALVEALVPALLYFKPRAGILFACIFTWLIAITPTPNNAGIFSLAQNVRFVSFLADVDRDISLPIFELSTTHGTFPALVIAVVLAVRHNGLARRAAPAVNTIVCALYSTMMLYSLPASKKNIAPSPPSPRPRMNKNYSRQAFLCLTAWYAIGALVTGTMDTGNEQMFANLASHGGSNHLFLPTGLLQWMTNEPIFIIENSTSTLINSMYPGEVTDHLAPDVLGLLRDVGHSGREFAAEMSRAAGTAGMRPNDPFHFVPYTVPGLELRRLVAEASSQQPPDSPFEIVYRRLGNETRLFTASTKSSHRQTPEQYAVRYRRRFDRPPLHTCELVRSSDDKDGGRTCPDEELAFLLSPPGFLASKFILHTPRPRLGDDWDVGCRC